MMINHVDRKLFQLDFVIKDSSLTCITMILTKEKPVVLVGVKMVDFKCQLKGNHQTTGYVR